MRNKTTVALVALALALLLTAWMLARCGEERLGGGPGPTAPAVKQVEYPRDKLRRARAQRQQPTPGTPQPQTATKAASTDRLARALASPGADGAVVIEVNAIRHSPLVEKLLACEQARKGDGALGLAQLEEELGVDVSEDVDRIGIDKDVVAVSGFFGKLKLPADLGEGEAVGDAGRLFRVKGDDGAEMVFGKVGDDVLLTGGDERQVRDSIERIEGRAPAGPGFPDGVAAGEVYGLLGPALLGELLTSLGDPAAASLASVVTQSRVQVGVDDAAALSLDLTARSPDDGRDLAKALGGAVTAVRAKAQQDGDAELVGLLEQARVDVDDKGAVAFDFAVPGDDLLRLFGCDADGSPLAGRERAPDAVPPVTTKQ